MRESTPVRIRINTETVEILKKLAEEDRRSLSNYVRIVLLDEAKKVANK